MAAQPNSWGIIGSRESTSSGRTRLRHEMDSDYWQRYYQSPLSKKPPTRVLCNLFPEVFESRLNAAGQLLDETNSAGEVIAADLLPRILMAIDKLMSPNEDDNDPPATEHAYQSARAVVESAYGRLIADKEAHSKQLPTPTVTTDERGGVRLSWQHGNRHVRTNFAAEEGMRSYLYFESPTEHNAEALEPSNLSTRLDWMFEV